MANQTEHALWLRLPSDNASAATPFVLVAGMVPKVLPGLILSGVMTRLLSGQRFREKSGYNSFMVALEKHIALLGLLYSYWPTWCCSPFQYWRRAGVVQRSAIHRVDAELQLALESSVSVNCFWQSSKAAVGDMTLHGSHDHVEEGSAWSEVMLAARERMVDKLAMVRRLFSDGMHRIAMQL
jgi:hypothetical protein